MIEIIYWTPSNYEESRFKPSKTNFEKLTAIMVVNNRNLDKDIYYELLTDRIRELLSTELNPLLAAQEAIDRMKDFGLHKPSRDDDDPASYIISHNWKVREYLQDIGLDIPRRIVCASTKESERAYHSTKTVRDWVDILIAMDNL